MSLLKLLSSGKSLVGLKDAGGRYQIAQQNLLPRFGGKKNPFRRNAGAGLEKTGSEPAEVVQPADCATSKNCEQSGLGQQDKPAGNLAEKAEAPRSGRLQASAGRLSLVKGLAARALAPAAMVKTKSMETSCKLWNGLAQKARVLLFWKKPAVCRGAGPRQPMQQAELTLDKVVVMRNDLTESDLEVVTTRPRSSRQGGEIAPSAGQPQARPAPGSDAAWERVSARIFGNQKSPAS
jgi:hypothetical protein